MKSSFLLIVTLFVAFLTHTGFQIVTSQDTKSTNEIKSNLRKEMDSMSINVYQFNVSDIDGNQVSLSDYRDKVLLIVNVASFCGYTKQYAGLEEIYKEFSPRGFEILAFPCNDFGSQEPGTNEEIAEFCSSKFGVTFKLFDKIKVLGDEKEPLFKLLIDNPVTGTGDIKWNFEKFLISREGNVVKRFTSKDTPTSEEMVNSILAEIER